MSTNIDTIASTTSTTASQNVHADGVCNGLLFLPLITSRPREASHSVTPTRGAGAFYTIRPSRVAHPFGRNACLECDAGVLPHHSARSRIARQQHKHNARPRSCFSRYPTDPCANRACKRANTSRTLCKSRRSVRLRRLDCPRAASERREQYGTQFFCTS